MLSPLPPPYDVADWRRLPFWERMRLVCQAWALQGYGAPLAVYLAYAAKLLFYVAGWAFFCTISTGEALSDIGQWWNTDSAFTKAILWTMVFEGLGLGCGSGPLTGRYVPPVGGPLYFLRPGTIALPLIRQLGDRRTGLHVLLYAALVSVLFWGLLAAEVGSVHLLPIVFLVPLLGVLDRTLFLVFRSEHYLSSVICLLAAGDAIAGNKVVWLAIWLWAATSKLNRHFPAVMCVMTSNAPWTRWGPLREMVYRSVPDDLRPSRAAAFLAHMGTAFEFIVPLLLVALGDAGLITTALLVGMTLFHLFILSNVPMGVPLEWNVIMIYGAWVLFGTHGDVAILSLSTPWLIVWLFAFHLCLPVYGSQVPRHVSFLLAMRYYAGNWPWSIWLFRGTSEEKLDVLSTPGPRVGEQLALLYDADAIEGMLSRVMAFRAMHLHGRLLQDVVPMMVDDIEDYVWRDGEIVAGYAIGWNFGAGHLHHEALLEAIQRRCDFRPGELRCLFVESEPFVGSGLSWRIVDAATGRVTSGEADVGDLVDRHPWPDVHG